MLKNSIDGDNSKVVGFSHVLFDKSKSTTKPIGVISVFYDLSVLQKIIDPVSKINFDLNSLAHAIDTPYIFCSLTTRLLICK